MSSEGFVSNDGNYISLASVQVEKIQTDSHESGKFIFICSLSCNYVPWQGVCISWKQFLNVMILMFSEHL